MVNNQNHHDLIRKVSMYLDNELNKEGERDFLREIQQNPDYYDLFQKEQLFRDLIRNKVDRKKVSPALIQAIKEKIRVTTGM